MRRKTGRQQLAEEQKKNRARGYEEKEEESGQPGCKAVLK